MEHNRIDTSRQVGPDVRRHRFDRNGKQRGLNWAVYGGLPNPQDPVVDGDPQAASGPVAGFETHKPHYKQSQERGSRRGGRANRKETA